MLQAPARVNQINFDAYRIGQLKLDDVEQLEEYFWRQLKTFEEMERDYIIQVLKEKKWKIGGENSAASEMGLNVSTLRGRMRKLGIKKPIPE